MTFQASRDYIWVDQSDTLSSLCDEWITQSFIAIDTEFERTATYYANAGLIQVATLNQQYLIDPLSDLDLTLLKPLLESEETVKVMHSHSEDVDLLHHITGAWTHNIFDTQIAAALCGSGAGMGYQSLVLEFTGVELDKSQTRSDWLARPLSSAQLSYAALDTQYLVALYQQLSESLKAKNLYEAVFEETGRAVVDMMNTDQFPERAYLKLKGAWSLSRLQQIQLKNLVVWRDGRAKTENLPKSWVMSDKQLISAVEDLVANRYQLSQIKGMKPTQVKRYGEAVLDILSLEPEAAEISLFEPIAPPIKGESLVAFKSLKKELQIISTRLGMEPQFLAPKRLLEQLIYAPDMEVPEAFQGWRKDCLGQAFIEAGLEAPSPLSNRVEVV